MLEIHQVLKWPENLMYIGAIVFNLSVTCIIVTVINYQEPHWLLSSNSLITFSGTLIFSKINIHLSETLVVQGFRIGITFCGRGPG